jgi:GntR family transcriptional regulator
MNDERRALLVRPLYLQARDAIANRILSGDWAPGAIIPNEAQLAQQLGLSLGTVRKALEILEVEHLIYRRQGRGTFVNDFSANRRPLTRFTDLQGNAIEGEKLAKSISLMGADEALAKRLEIEVGDEVIRVARIRLARKRPFATEVVYLPGKRFPNRRDDLAVSWLSALAQANGLLIGEAKEVLSLGLAAEHDVKDLRVSSGTPLAILDREVFSDRKEVLEWRTARCDLSNVRLLFMYR